MSRALQIGFHVSISESIALAFDRALELGCTTFQIFTRNPQRWAFKELSDEEVAEFLMKRSKHDFNRIASHMPYLPNLASPDKVTIKKSRASLNAEVRRCDRLGIDYVVTHLGSHLGKGTMVGVRNIAAACNEALDASAGESVILLENTAGSSNSVGGRFEDLKMILDLVKKRARVGVCFDTCLPPGSPVLRNGLPTAIESVAPGEEVASLDGSTVSVTHVLRRQYIGQLIGIKPKGLPWVRATAEHPFLCVKLKGMKSIESSPWRVFLTESPSWVDANHIVPGNYLVMPKLRPAGETSVYFTNYIGMRAHSLTFPLVMPLTEDFAELLGLYLAEGFTYMGRDADGFERGKIYLSFGKHEKELIRKTIRLFDVVFSLKAWTDENPTAIKVCIGSNPLARFLADNFGPNAREKTIPSFIMYASNVVVRAFLLGYLAGDGCVDKSGIRFVTASQSVALQLIHLLARLNIRGTFGWHKPTESEIRGRAIIGSGWFVVRVGRADARNLGFHYHLPTAPARTILRDDHFFYIPIAKVEREYYDGTVINLTTESGSFLAPFAVTHNCHAFASGFDLSTRAEVEKTMLLFDEVVGLDDMKLVHLNDSKGPLGGGLDRHEHVGLGRIGKEGFKAFLHNPHASRTPLVMETPPGEKISQKAELKNVLKLAM